MPLQEKNGVMVKRKEDINSDFTTALARAKILLEAFCIKDTATCEVAEGGSSLSADFAVSIPSRMRANGISGTGVKAVEPVTFLFPDKYPNAAPFVFLRDNFPENTPHFTPALMGFSPQPCLVIETLEEFYLAEGFAGILSQLIVWLNKAAAGTLVGSKAGWEPTPRFRLNSFISADLSQIQQLANISARSSTYLPAPYYAPTGGAKHTTNVIVPRELADKEPDLEEMINHGQLKATTGASGCLAAAFWSKPVDNKPSRVSDKYFPENIRTHNDLQSRLDQIGDDNTDGIISLLLRARLFFEKAGYRDNTGNGDLVPIPVFLLVNRPFELAGSKSSVEVLSYIIDFRPNVSMEDITENRVEFVVHQAMIMPALNQSLLSRMDDYSDTASASIIGAGSVGSKIAVSLARAGWDIPVVYDKNIMLPHNYARHEFRPMNPGGKAVQLANTIKLFDQETVKAAGNVLDEIDMVGETDTNLTKNAQYLINSTASELVRKALAQCGSRKSVTRFIDASLLLQGRAARLTIEGGEGNPGYADLDALFYAKAAKTGLAKKFLSADSGLMPVETGMGCSSLTMKMSDARLSAMTGLITEHIMEFHDRRIPGDNVQSGELVFWERNSSTGNLRKDTAVVEPFQVVDLDKPGWTMRISPSVINHIENDRKIFPHVETGGLLMGVVDEKTKTVTVVDTLDAPPDSRRSPTEFTLSNTGLRIEVENYFKKSGRALYDVGTWHTHLLDQPPSAKDKSTAMELCQENRSDPFVLLVHTPSKVYGLLADPAANDKEVM